MSIYDKIMKNKKLLDKTINKNKKMEYISTGVITLNLLHSGKVRGGIPKGCISMISADSSLGKTFIGLSTLKNAQKLGMECIVVDSEKSFDFDWAEKIGIDTSEKKLKVVRLSRTIDIEMLVSDMVEGYTTEQRENIFCLIDSWGTLISHVNLKKASEGSDTKDMSLPGWKNQLANIMKESDITSYVVNHVYDNTGGYGDPLKIPGGKRLYFNSESVVLARSKAKSKNNDEIDGAIISAIVHKGRKAVESKALKYRIKHNGGLDVFYGLLNDALEHGCVIKPKSGFYSRPCIKDDQLWREKKIYCSDFWLPIFKETDFEEFLELKYTFKGRSIDISEQDIVDILSQEEKEIVVKKNKKSKKVETVDGTVDPEV